MSYNAIPKLIHFLRENILKFQTHMFLFPNKMLVIKTGIHTMLVRKANKGDPQTASSEAA